MSSRDRRGQTGMPEISTCLWFDDNLMEAVEFYTRVFPNSEVRGVSHYDDGRVLAAEWTPRRATVPRHQRRAGARRVHRDGLAERQLRRPVRGRLLLGHARGRRRPGQCAWLKDRFGLSWQIVPVRLYELLSDPDPARAQAATAAMMEMQKIVIADLEAAADAAR